MAILPYFFNRIAPVVVAMPGPGCSCRRAEQLQHLAPGSGAGLAVCNHLVVRNILVALYFHAYLCGTKCSLDRSGHRRTGNGAGQLLRIGLRRLLAPSRKQRDED